MGMNSIERNYLNRNKEPKIAVNMHNEETRFERFRLFGFLFPLFYDDLLFSQVESHSNRNR